MKVLVNGIEKELNAETNIKGLIENFGLKCETTVVEINGEIIERELFDKTAINDGDKVELIRFVGGG